MSVQILLTLNLYRISCKACLFIGRLSINDTDDIDDMGETSKAFGAHLMIDTQTSLSMYQSVSLHI
jgi:predicted lactoylglutathione lyase